MARIVIVEDEAAVARVVAHYLCKAGRLAIVAATGAAALQAADTDPDLSCSTWDCRTSRGPRSSAA